MRRESAQSEVIGVVLFVGVVVTLVIVGAAVTLPSFTENSDRPFVSIDAEATTQNITLSHKGGDSVDTDSLTVILRADDTERYEFESFTQLSGDDGTRFEQGDTWYRSHGLDGDRMEVLLVHDPSSTILDRETVPIEETLAARFETSPSNPTTLSTIEFDGSGSVAKDSEITNYAWAFGDGTTDSGEVVTHSYDDAGTYDVTLTVDTADGRTHSTTEQVDVSSPNPVASFTFDPTNPDANQDIEFDAADSEAPGSTIASYEWDFDDDGTTDETGEVVTNSFAAYGSYDVTLTVTDQEGETATTTRTISVEKPDIRIYNARPDGDTVVDFDVENPQDNTVTLTGIALNGTSAPATEVNNGGNDELVFTGGGRLDAGTGNSAITIDGTKYTLTTVELVDSGETTTGTLAEFDQPMPGETLTLTLYYEIDGEPGKQTETVEIEERPFFDVEIIGTNSPVEEVDTVEVTYEVTNTGDATGTQNIALQFDGEGGETDQLQLDPGESAQNTLSYDLDTFQKGPGTYDSTVFTDDTSDTTTVDVIPESAPFFEVTITGTNAPVTEGETLEVDATVENTGESDDTQTVTLDTDGTERDSQELQIASGESESVTLAWATGPGDAGDYEATVSSENTSDSTDVTVADQPFFESLSGTVSDSRTGGPGGETEAEAVEFTYTLSESVSQVELTVVDGDGVTTTDTGPGDASEQTVTVELDGTGAGQPSSNFPLELTADIDGGECRTATISTPDETVTGDDWSDC